MPYSYLFFVSSWVRYARAETFSTFCRGCRGSGRRHTRGDNICRLDPMFSKPLQLDAVGRWDKSALMSWELSFIQDHIPECSESSSQSVIFLPRESSAEQCGWELDRHQFKQSQCDSVFGWTQSGWWRGIWSWETGKEFSGGLLSSCGSMGTIHSFLRRTRSNYGVPISQLLWYCCRFVLNF